IPNVGRSIWGCRRSWMPCGRRSASGGRGRVWPSRNAKPTSGTRVRAGESGRSRRSPGAARDVGSVSVLVALLRRVPEVPDAFPDALSKFGQTAGAEDQDDDEENDEQFGNAEAHKQLLPDQPRLQFYTLISTPCGREATAVVKADSNGARVPCTL